MNVLELKELLGRVMDTTAEIRVGTEDGSFYDGQTVTGLMIMHNMVNGKDEVCVFIVGDATKKQRTEMKSDDVL